MDEKISKSEAQQRLLFQEAASRILEELEIRGFTTEESSNAEDLQNKITDIIFQTVRGNTNYCVTPTSEEMTQEDWDHLNKVIDTLKKEPDGWKGDLVNQ